MAGSFFDTLSAQDKQQIAETTEALVEVLTEWAQRYALVRSKRVPAVALLIAAVSPRLSLPAAVLVAKMTFWIFELDDLADERAITLAVLQQKTEDWYLNAHDGSTDPLNSRDELATMLLEIRDGLSNYQLFEPLCESWAIQVRLLAEAMAQEYQYGLQYSGGQAYALPSLDEYLRYGAYSIGSPLWTLTVAIVSNDASTLDCFEAIDAAALCAGAAMRLYNDYQTVDKEMQEGNINAAIILYHTLLAGSSDANEERVLAEARQHVLRLADSYAQKCSGLVGQFQTASRQIEETLLRIVAFHAYFYSEYDYHSTSMADAKAMLGSRRS